MKIVTYISIGFENIINLFFSTTCAGCNQALTYGQKHLCISCVIHLPINQTKNPSELFWGRVPIKNGLALLNFEKGNSTQQLLHKIKYKDQQQLARYLGEKIGRQLIKEEWTKNLDLIIPVPLHPSKERKRGYNQSLLLAEGIQKVLSIQIEKNILKRTSANVTQTKKNKYERWDNVQQVFKLVDSKKITNKHVLLIDDAITTGATLEACIRALQKADNCNVSIATLAIAK